MFIIISMSNRRGEVIDDQEEQLQQRLEDFSPRHQTHFVELPSQKQELSPMGKTNVSPERIRAPQNTGVQPNVDIEQKINNIFRNHEKEAFAGLFKAGLQVFQNHEPYKILSLIFKGKVDKSLQQEIQKMLDIIKIYRRTIQSTNESENQARSILLNTIKKQNVQHLLTNIIAKIIETKDLLLIKDIEKQVNITHKAKKVIFETILTNQVIGKFLRPKAAEDLLEEKLKTILKSMKKNICDPLIEQFLIDRNFDFLNNMDKYPSMDDVTLSKGQKDLIKLIASQIPEYKIFVDSSQSDVGVYKHDFIKTILKATTLSNSFTYEQIELKYGLINALIDNPCFNIYQYKDKISKDQLQRILDQISLSLFKYIQQKYYIEPLALKKQKDIDSILAIISSKISQTKYDEFKKYLLSDNYDGFFKDPEVGSFVTDFWNKYKDLKNCSQAFLKQNQDVEQILQALKWELNLIFTKNEISKKLQEDLIQDILASGNLLSIEKSDDISKNQCKQLLTEISKLQSLKGYVKAKFETLPLKQRVKYQLTNVLINIPVGTGSKDSLYEPLTYKKIMTIIDKLIETKNINDISSSSFLTNNEKPIITRQLNGLLTPRSKSVFKQWICWQGVDLNVSFKTLAPDVYNLIRTEHQIDCKVYEKILQKIKETGDIDFLENILELTESQKVLLKKGLENNKNLKNYKNQLDTKNISISAFNILNQIEEEFPDFFEKEDIQLFYHIIINYLEARQDLFSLGLQGSTKTLKALLEIQKVVKALEKVTKGESYKTYSQNFPSTFTQKEKKCLQRLRLQISEALEDLYPGKDDKNKKILGNLEKQQFKITQMKNSDQQEVPKNVLNNIQNLPALKEYQAIQFVKTNRIDLISNCSYKKFIQVEIAKTLPLAVRQNIVNLLLNWRIGDVIDHNDLSLSDKKKIFEKIAGSKEFQKCSNVISNNITTKIPDLTKGILEIINFCNLHSLEIDEELKKLAKTEFTVQIQSYPPKTYKMDTTFNDFLNQQKALIPPGVILKVGNQELTEKNFAALTLNSPILNIKLYKKVELKHKNSTKSQEFALGAPLRESVTSKITSLGNIKFELTDGTNLLNGVVTPSTNSIVVEEFTEFDIDGNKILHKNSSNFGELKASAKIAQLEGEGGQTFDDKQLLENVMKKVPSLKFKAVKQAVDPAVVIRQMKQSFKNWKNRGAGDQWGALIEEPESFAYAYEKIFDKMDMGGFVKDEFAAMKKIKRGKLRDYLQGLEEYKQFAKLAGIELIVVEK